MRFSNAILVLALTLVACAGTPDGFTDKPTPIAPGAVVDARSAVLLVGISGPAAVDYLQFVHSSFPAINARFPARGDEILAIPVAVGLKQVTLGAITLAGRPGSYVGATAVGYVPIRTQRLDIDRPGLYFITTLDTSKPGTSSTTPDPQQLRQLRASLGEALAPLQPANFTWP